MNTPNNKQSNGRTLKPLKGIHPGNSNSLIRSSRSSLKVQSRIQFFEKKGISSGLPQFMSTCALPPLPPQPDRKRAFDDSFGAQSSDLKPCAKQICIQNNDLGSIRQRVPLTNPHCRTRLLDQICSVPRLPDIDRSAYKSQMTLINMFPVRKTVETQTSPTDSTKENDSVSRSSSLKENSRYRRNSRSLLNSVTLSARRTATCLKRSTAQDRILNFSPSVPNLPQMKSRKSLENSTKSTSKLRSIGKSLKNLTRRLGSHSSQSALWKSQSKLKSIQSEQSPSKEDSDNDNDSLRCVTIKRPVSKIFGFFIQKNEKDEVFVTQISPEGSHLTGLLKKGDTIHTINGLHCKYLSLSEINESIIGKEELVLQTTSHSDTF